MHFKSGMISLTNILLREPRPLLSHDLPRKITIQCLFQKLRISTTVFLKMRYGNNIPTAVLLADGVIHHVRRAVVFPFKTLRIPIHPVQIIVDGFGVLAK